MNDDTFGVAALAIAALISLAFVGLYVWSIIWSYGDAERRGKSGCLVALLVALASWPIGLIIWLVARPEEQRRRE